MFIFIKIKIMSILPHTILQVYFKVKDLFSGDRVLSSYQYIKYVSGKKGIEIGGPSPLFKYSLPIYKRILDLDGVNFSNETLWEGKIREGKTFEYYKNKKGLQFINDGTDLLILSDKSYDFVLSSNCLEHIANPIKALNEWRRILKISGIFILVLPNKKSNFDHKRPITSYEHLIEDYKNNISENDLSHFDEIIALHDLTLDPPAGDFDNFYKRSLDNYKNRAFHHHVFDLALMTRMIEDLGFEIISKTETTKNLIVLSKKSF